MPKRLFQFFVYFLLLCCTKTLFAQALSEKVDNYVEKAMIERHIPGLSLAVIHDGVTIKVKGFGLSNIENKIPVNPETIFQSGSIGKQFTATAILQLKEEGKLKLDDKISRYFAGTPATWQNITIRNLLTHTSGIPDFPEDSTGINLQNNYTEQDLLRLAIKLPLGFKTGEKWAYSNTGYVLLGILIHQITGKFYGEILQEKIFAPLSMETIRIINEPDIIMNRSSGYELKNGEWKNQSWVAPSLNTTADGSLYLTILDLIKWDAAITKEKILNHEDLQSMVTPAKLNNDSLHPYGFAWFLDPVNGHKAFQHSGSWQGFNNYIARFPDDKLTIIVLTNLNPSNPGLIAKDIAAIYIPELSRPKVTVIKDDNATMTNLITDLFKNPTVTDLNNQFISKDAIPKLKALTVSNNSLLKIFGKVETVLPLESVNNSNQSKYLIKYKVGARVAIVTKNKLGQIINIVSESE
ncbi:MAG: serine hydrolase domain-containing protein [Ferruginibacter sp.]